MSKELEELKKSIANNSTIKRMAKQSAETQKTIADAINNSKGIDSLAKFYDTPKIIHKPPVDIDEEEWKEIKNHYSGQFLTLDVNMNWIECSLDNVYEQWKKGSYPDKVAFLEALDNQFNGLADMYNERKKRDYTSTELFTHYYDEWEKVAYQVKWDGTMVDKMLLNQVIELETDIQIYFDKRTKHGLLMTEKMRAFTPLTELTKKLWDKIELEEAQNPKLQLLEGHPPIEPTEDLGDNNMYIIADDFDKEWEEKKLTEAFRWCKSDRINYFNWVAQKYTFKNGKIITSGKALERCLNKAKYENRL